MTAPDLNVAPAPRSSTAWLHVTCLAVAGSPVLLVTLNEAGSNYLVMDKLKWILPIVLGSCFVGYAVLTTALWNRFGRHSLLRTAGIHLAVVIGLVAMLLVTSMG